MRAAFAAPFRQASACQHYERRGFTACSLRGEGQALRFIALAVTVNQLAGGEVVFGMARVVPLVEEMHVESREQALPGLLLVQGEYVFRLGLQFLTVVAILHPDVFPGDDQVPEGRVIIELERDLLA